MLGGQGQAPARQASLGAGIPQETGATTVNKMCGSGMKATMLAQANLLAGSHRVMVAGGMESMTNAPYLLPKARAGMRMGHSQAKDHMFLDGLEDAYDKGKLMGEFAENTAETFQFTREAQDAFAITSLDRALKATEDGTFAREMITVTVKNREGENKVERDEQPMNARPDKIPDLKPAFRDGGTVTAANSSSISDGAAALVLMRRSEAEMRGLSPLAAIRAHATYAAQPEWFTTAPIGAVNKVLEHAHGRNGVDLFEINEAFAVVTMAAIRELGLSHDEVNIHGGACALGHPIGIGSEDRRFIIECIGKTRSQKGIATLCIGGGEATAMAIERIH